jgi:hypothetical protein
VDLFEALILALVSHRQQCQLVQFSCFYPKYLQQPRLGAY